jgi:hypothetical protein
MQLFVIQFTIISHRFYAADYGPGSSVGTATGYGLDGPGIESRWGEKVSAPVQTGPVAHPASCAMGTGSFPGVKSGRGVTLTPHPLLVLWSIKGRAIPLLPLWTVRPVQSLSACTRVTFTFLYTVEISMFKIFKILKLSLWAGANAPAHKLSANFYDIYHCCVYTEKLLMMDRGTARNM